MKNTLSDLNDHLFAQLERLNDEDLNEDGLKKEVQRAKALTDIADKVIENGKLVLDSEKTKLEWRGTDGGQSMPKMLEAK